MKKKRLYYVLFFLFHAASCFGQSPYDSTRQMPLYKNIIRYNLSGALIFGFGNYIVLGYERMVSTRQSFSLNAGYATLPKLNNSSTDSFYLQRQGEKSGFNLSADYRFYLTKENKFKAPHGVYIGPYYSYSHFERKSYWTHRNRIATNEIRTQTNFNIHTIGCELGYQFIWKRLALDVVMAGPGIGFYKYQASFTVNATINADEKQQLLDGLKQVLMQKIPGMNVVFSDKELDVNGVIKTSDIGYRYIIHIGFNF